ncbi:MAG: hypothetical protein V4719_19515 [Planctomycetota bacterium]
MSRSKIPFSLIFIVSLTAGVVFFSRGVQGRKEIPPVTVLRAEGRQKVDLSSPPTTISKPVAPAAVAKSQVIELPKPQVAASPIAASAADMSSSSWENPFSPELWESSGWTFGPQSMQTVGAEAASAVFRRPYHKLMFECDVQAAELPGSMWELRLATHNDHAVMSLILRDGRLSIVATENGLTRVVVEKTLAAPLSATTVRQIRVVATGNRVVVSWDRKRFLTAEQLAAQSGREITWSLQTSGAKYEIPRLRVEGE